jgi:hypothetical protein
VGLPCDVKFIEVLFRSINLQANTIESGKHA